MATLSETYNNQIDRIAERADLQGKAITQGAFEEVKWMTPDGLSTDQIDKSGNELHDPFEREGPNQDFVDAITQGQGSSGDMVVSALQVDTLAQMERAYRARHITRVRTTVHAAGRLEIHGRDGGVFKKSHRAFLERLLKLAPRES